MKIEIKEKIKIIFESKEEKEKTKRILLEELTFMPNTKDDRLGVRPQVIAIYHYDKKDDVYYIPRGRYSILDKFMEKGIKITSLKDLREKGRKIELKANFELRDEIQRNAFDAYLKAEGNVGTLNLGCGIGK